jgi:hypothetical protein
MPMSKPRPGVVAVDAGLVAKTLVDAVCTRVDDLPQPEPGGPIGEALEDLPLSLVSKQEGAVEMKLRRAGYLARKVEVELFDPAKKPAAWLAKRLRERHAIEGDWAAAVTSLCAELARAEPVGKPDPDDPAATTWKIPGPGGHVRHYVARRSIEEHLQGRDRPFDGDPADLKIPWAYGLFVHACEEVLPQEDPPDT